MNNKMLKILTVSASLLAAPATLLAAEANTQEPDRQMQNSANEASGHMSEAWIQTKLEAAFAADDQLSAWDIDTEVQGNTAYLSGTVDSEAVKELAEETAKNIEGIADVENKLQVKADQTS